MNEHQFKFIERALENECINSICNRCELLVNCKCSYNDILEEIEELYYGRG
jgi:hypothetical protein